MKELSTEEKAKAYDNIIEKANKMHSENCEACQMCIEELIPELKESEEERIRKEIISMSNTLGKTEWIAWLEKQGLENDIKEDAIHLCNELIDTINKQCEQKPADRVEPKFKVGDIIINNENGAISKVNKILYYDYQLISFETGKHSILDQTLIKGNSKLWTIQDAKDGDVLCTYECGKPKIVFILKGAPEKPYVLGYHCFYNIMYPHFEFDSEKGCLAPNEENVKPATKEQRDLLFQKMKEAGYVWDADGKKLEKVEQNPVIISKFRVGDWIQPKDKHYPPCQIKSIEGDIVRTKADTDMNDNVEKLTYLEKGWELVKQKPVEPKFRVGDTVKAKTIDYFVFTIKDITDKQYVDTNGGKYDIEGQDYLELVEQNSAWSEDNLPEFESYLCLMFQKFRTKGMCTNGEIIDYVKEHSQKLKDALCHPWSEEDERERNHCIDFLNHPDMIKATPTIANGCKEWLKSLKDRVQPKQEWSEEDENRFKNLVYLVEYSDEGKATKEGFVKFINRLKSLRPQNWTKEDKERYISCLQRLSTGNPTQPETINSKWFKEHVYPQNRWKPSEEQMEVLLSEVLAWTKGCPKQIVLESLYQDLKKLREE